MVPQRSLYPAKYMKFTALVLLTCFAAFFIPQNSTAQCTNQSAIVDHRSDSIDLLKTTLHLNITDFVTKVVSGRAVIKFKAKVNGIGTIRLDLLALTVDSVSTGNAAQTLAFSHVGEEVNINLLSALNQNAEDSIVVYYHGVPQADASGFGGFAFSGSNYAYNIGVAFEAQPHNFGRCWFPTFDNFEERFILEEYITVPNGYMAVCNGTLLGTTANGNNTQTNHWRLRDDIPSYLASVAVANYVPVNKSFPSIGGGSIPVQLYARPADTTNLKNSFANLQGAFNTFENRFGPYRWERVGYVVVPFMAGAMEHATNISYPLFGVNGALTYESTMAHELSHMWFGDYVTCDKAEEMYLNEGFARYCEAIFFEGVYGYNKYLEDIKANHLKVLRYTYVDEGYQPVGNVLQVNTYGSTVYEKGADIVHTLRSYMGDDAFFTGIKQYLNNNALSTVNSTILKDELEASSGQQLDDFFNDWVCEEGYPHFAVDSFEVVPSGGQYTVTVHVRQKLKNAPHYYSNVPFNIFFKGANFEESVQPLVATGANTQATFVLPFYPVFAALNMDDRISHAITADKKVITQTGSVNFGNGLCVLDVSAVTDSALVYVEHNWVGPDTDLESGDDVTFSPERYWRVSGVRKPGFVAHATFVYNGRTPASANSGWLDNGLITAGEDSLVLLYRPGPGWNWKKCKYTTQNNQNNSTDKIGKFEVDSLQFGEYCLAKGTIGETTGIKEIASNRLHIYPNPATNNVTVETQQPMPANTAISIVSSVGVVVKELTTANATNKLTVDVSQLAPGVYYIRIGSSAARFVVL